MKKQNLWFHIFTIVILTILALTCLIPFVLMLSASFTSGNALTLGGFRLIPKEFSLEAYRYAFLGGTNIIRAYALTAFVTVAGTALGLTICTLLSYALSREEFVLGKILTFFVFFTLLFNGGLVPTYIIYTQWFHIKNTIYALIFPSLLMNGVNVLLMRTWIKNNLPQECIEAARIDGGNEFQCFVQIVFPLSKPILATIGLMIGLGYWNDWFNSMIYITDNRLFSLQNFLARIIENMNTLLKNANVNMIEIANMPSEVVRMAVAVLGCLPIIVAFPFFQKYFVKGIALGAIKG